MGIPKKRHKKRGQIVVAAAVLVAVSAVGIGGYGRWKYNQPGTSVSAAQGLEDVNSNSVAYDGKQYEYNEHLSNFLFLGVDESEKVATSQGQADAGQADAIFLVSRDRVKDKITLITIPRDTMTDIEIYDTSGKSLGKSRDHISLAYAYGDGGHRSCELSKEAVSNLLYGLPIQGYCAVNMDGISIMIEDIGGLAVTVPDDSLEDRYPEFKEGTEVELTQENAEIFVRYRDVEESQSAIKRLKRQSVFMDAYVTKAVEIFEQNPKFLTKLYKDLEPSMVTNIGTDQFAEVMKDISTQNVLSKWTVPGEGAEGVSFDEYHVDDDKLYEMILQTFYEEIQ